MKKMKLSVKLIAGFLSVAVIATVIGLVGIFYIHKIRVADTHLYEGDTVPLAKAAAIEGNFQEIRVLFRDLITERDEETRKWLTTMVQELRQQNNESIKVLEATLNQPAEIKMLNDLKGALAGYRQAMDKVSAAANTGNEVAARGIMAGEGATAAKQMKLAVEGLVDFVVKEAKATAEGNKSLAATAITITIILTIVGTALAALLGIFLTLAITRPINRIVSGLTDGANQVSSAASQVSSTSQSLAEGTAEQAASLEETSSSLEEMSSMTKQNADNANQAKAMMSEAGQVVEKVDHHMREMAGAVADIIRSSEETGKIIKTIDEIAFQTNLLALNAAVEAARAGEAGAGFAVVADEVRNLAMRASEAAKNTNNLIENTIKAVHKGSELTNTTQEAFQENAEIAKKISQLIDEIATASQEQSHGISQVNIAVSEMDKVTQSTAANAEESAAAAEELNAQAEQMKVYVGDLVAVVGGSANGRGAAAGAVGFQHEPTAAPAVSEKTAGRQHARSGKAAKKVSRPEQLIPLKEGGFADF